MAFSSLYFNRKTLQQTLICTSLEKQLSDYGVDSRLGPLDGKKKKCLPKTFCLFKHNTLITKLIIIDGLHGRIIPRHSTDKSVRVKTENSR